MPANPAPHPPVPSVLFCSFLSLNVKYLHLIVRAKEPKPDVNYDLGDNVEDDHWQSVSLDKTAEGFNSKWWNMAESLLPAVDLCEWNGAPQSICFYNRKVRIPVSFKTIKKLALRIRLYCRFLSNHNVSKGVLPQHFFLCCAFSSWHLCRKLHQSPVTLFPVRLPGRLCLKCIANCVR